MPEKLLTREQFRLQTLSRQPGCDMPFCSAEKVDAHHILNRNLWTEEHEKGGYFLSNGAGLCARHHYAAELTLLSVEDLRQSVGIVDFAMPARFNRGLVYDTWGNQILSTGVRKPGPLFNDPGCQKALKAAGVLWQFIGR